MPGSGTAVPPVEPPEVVEPPVVVVEPPDVLVVLPPLVEEEVVDELVVVDEDDELLDEQFFLHGLLEPQVKPLHQSVAIAGDEAAKAAAQMAITAVFLNIVITPCLNDTAGLAKRIWMVQSGVGRVPFQNSSGGNMTAALVGAGSSQPDFGAPTR